jgi:kinesin family member 2/24
MMYNMNNMGGVMVPGGLAGVNVPAGGLNAEMQMMNINMNQNMNNGQNINPNNMNNVNTASTSANGQMVSQSTRNSPRLTVVIRKRPANRKERTKGEDEVVMCVGPGGDFDNPNNNHAVIASTRQSGGRQYFATIVREPKLKVDLTKYTEEHHFQFDKTYGEAATNEEIYTNSVQAIVQTAFERGRCTCFAYGQTGSGRRNSK